MIEPILHRVVVKPESIEDFSEEHKHAKRIGLIIPELEDAKRVQASVDRGKVVALGATAYRDYGIDPPVSIGDIVNYARFSGKLIKDTDGQEFVILNDEDIICILKD